MAAELQIPRTHILYKNTPVLPVIPPQPLTDGGSLGLWPLAPRANPSLDTGPRFVCGSVMKSVAAVCAACVMKSQPRGLPIQHSALSPVRSVSPPAVLLVWRGYVHTQTLQIRGVFFCSTYPIRAAGGSSRG